MLTFIPSKICILGTSENFVHSPCQNLYSMEMNEWCVNFYQNTGQRRVPVLVVHLDKLRRDQAARKSTRCTSQHFILSWERAPPRNFGGKTTIDVSKQTAITTIKNYRFTLFLIQINARKLTGRFEGHAGDGGGDSSLVRPLPTRIGTCEIIGNTWRQNGVSTK